MLRFSDLVIRCERCKGEGHYKEIRSQSRMSTTTYEGPCEVCGGVGGEITEQGREFERFMDFLRSRRYPSWVS